MDSFLKYLNENPLLNLLFIFLGIFSILITIFLYFRGKKEKLPVYNKRSIVLIKNEFAKVKKLKVTVNNKIINNLTLTQVSLWNAGREKIENKDIAPADILRIEIKPPFEILQAEISYIRTKANNFSINQAPDKRKLFIDFDYFHTKDGICIDIYHTGTSDEDIQLLGTIKGVEKIRLIKSERFSYVSSLYEHIMFIIDPPYASGSGVFAGVFIIPLSIPVFFILMLIDIAMLFNIRTPKPFRLKDKW